MKSARSTRITETNNSSREGAAHVEIGTTMGVIEELRSQELSAQNARMSLLCAQKQLYVGQKLNPESRAFNAGGYAVIKGPLDLKTFQEASAACIAETEALHLRFLSDADEPYQVLGPLAGAPLKIIDKSADLDPFAAAMAWMQRELKQELNLESGRTFSWSLLRLAPEHFIFCTIYHHIVVDGLSGVLLARRVRQLYQAIKTGTASKPITSPSLASLVKSEQVYRSSDSFAEDRQYWMEQLVDRPNLVSLSKSSNTGRTWESHCGSAWLPAEAVEGLVNLAAELKTSLPRLVMATVGITVSRLTGSSDLLLGLVVTGRGGRFRSIPANLTHILPLRLQLSEDMCLRDAVLLTATKMEGANTHKLYQVEDIRSDLGLNRSHPGLFGIEVNIMPFFFNEEEFGLSWAIHSLSLGPVEDLCISIRDRGEDGRLRIDFNGNKDRYEKADLAEISLRFEKLLLSVAAASPETRLSDISIIDLDERQQVIKAFNQSAASFSPQCLPDLFEAQVERTPHMKALTFGAREFSYRDLDDAANRVARHLIARSVGTEDIVALLLPRGIELVVTMIGIVKAGAAYLPLDTDHPAARLLFMLRDSGAALLVTTTEICSRLVLPSSLPCLLLDDKQEQGEIANRPASRVTQAERLRPLQVSSLLYVIYTSGSTGEPKGVAIEHRSFSIQMKKMVRRIPMRADETILGITTTTFDPAAFEIFLPLLQGASLTLLGRQESRDPVFVASVVKALGGCVLQATPTFWRALLQSGIPRTVRALIGGEGLSSDLVPQLLEFPEAINLYGPTETTVDSSFHRLVPEDAERSAIVTIGRPLEDEQFYILDASLKLVPTGATGELYIAGSGLARGYLNRPDLNQERFVKCPFGEPDSLMYRTGDLGRWSKNGEVDFLGRVDQQIKIRGIRIEPGEVEVTLLRNIPVMKECAVVSHHLRGQTQLVAYFTMYAGFPVPTPPQLRENISRFLPEAMVPQIFMHLEKIPLTFNGKVDRRALPEPELGSNPASFQAPETVEESIICAVFAELTGALRVSRDDDFFRLGGNSLAAVLCIYRLQRELHQEVTLRQLFDAPSPEGLARLISKKTQHPLMGPPGDSSRPLVFLLPGLCGDEPGLVRFRILCDPSVRFLMLDYPGWKLITERLGIDILVRHVIRQIQSEAPDGPVWLMGYSFGAYCSYAVARELSRIGREVAFIGLLDPSAPTELPQEDAAIPVGWRFFHTVERQVRAIRQGMSARVFALAVVRLLNSPPGKPFFALARRMRNPRPSSRFGYYLNYYLNESRRVAAMTYWYKSVEKEPLPLSAPTFLFRSEDHSLEEPDDLGWGRHFKSVSTINLTGFHHTIFDPPHLASLCDETGKVIASIAARVKSSPLTDSSGDSRLEVELPHRIATPS
jgi:amino acid adenylation domain-containing protein